VSTGHENKKQVWIDKDVDAKLRAKMLKEKWRGSFRAYVSRILGDYGDDRLVEEDAVTSLELVLGLYAKREIDERQLDVLIARLKAGDLAATMLSRRSRLSLKRGPGSS
jgi:hypothetical protein